MAASSTRVTVVTVTYESARTLPGFLASCPAAHPVIVVDNASQDDSVGLAERHGAQVIRLPANQGFGAGCNAGADAAGTEYVLFANPDSRLSAEAIDALVKVADVHPEAGIVAPLLHDGSGRLVRTWDVEHVRRRRLPRSRDAEPFPSGNLCVDYVSGACMLIRRTAELRFDPIFFLYFEDDDICTAARSQGLSIILCPDARVAHAGGGSSTSSQATVNKAISRLKATHMARSRLQYVLKHWGHTAAAAEARERTAHHARKALGHALQGRLDRLSSDLAALSGTRAWIRGR